MHFYRLILNLVILACCLTSFCDAGKKGRKKNRKGRNKMLSGKCKVNVMAEYELSFQGMWSEREYPKMYPKFRPPAQWSKLVGRSHSGEYAMWREDTFASESVQMFAERADTKGFDIEAQGYGGVKDTFTAAPILGGLGKTVTNFVADGRHAKLSFMVKLVPSPDWFVGVASFDLCDRKRWKSFVDLNLYPMDAGTDKGLTFTSPVWPAEPHEKVYQLSPTKPMHSASSFYYPNKIVLPPIAKVKLTKLSEYRRKGKSIPPVKQERNLVIFEDVKEVIPKVERIIDRVVDKAKQEKQNEILSPRAEPLKDDQFRCLVSEWSGWTTCTKTCGFGVQSRTRTITRRPIRPRPGTHCPVLREDKTCGSMKTCQWQAFQFLKVVYRYTTTSSP